MSNAFATAPPLPPLVLPDSWVCPITGLKVPKDPDANLKWRADLLEAADKDKSLQEDLFTACSQSVLFFINAFVFTLRVFEYGDQGEKQQAEHKHLPFVTWPIQDKHILRLEYGIDNGEPCLTDKSRDMGATWDHVALYVHRLLFRPDESHLMLSRKEEAVDKLNGIPKNYPFGALADPGTLFGKLDYILNRLPDWMLPKLLRKSMVLVNLNIGTRIDGESSNATAGSSDRRTSILLDEMAKMDDAESIWRSTDDVTACRFPNSTPNGAGTTFSKVRQSGIIDVFVMPWWEHPEKGRDRYTEQDENGRWKIRSPAYDLACETKSPKEMAIEWDMDHVGSGETFFSAHVIEQHKIMFAREPKKNLSIKFKKEISDDDVIQAITKRDLKTLQVSGTPAGGWKIWVELNDENRPDQSKSYTFGIDIGKGQGASNSTVSVVCDQTREKVAAFASANLPPHEFARSVVAGAIWFGGQFGRPLLIWENNGDPGFYFGLCIANTFRYPRIYFDRQAGTLNQKSGVRYGWRSSPEKKAQALGLLDRAYAHGRFINHDEIALNEALTYIHYEGNGIGPANLVEESDNVRKAHGDRVIADMLCTWTLDEPRQITPPEWEAPERSFGFRMQQHKAKKKQELALDGTPGKPRRFDFSQPQQVGI